MTNLHTGNIRCLLYALIASTTAWQVEGIHWINVCRMNEGRKANANFQSAVWTGLAKHKSNES